MGSSRPGVSVGSETAGFEKALGDVVGEVAEAECGPAQVFEPAADCFGGAVAGAGVIEEREDVIPAFCKGAAESCDLDQAAGDRCADRVDQAVHDLLPGSSQSGV